MLARIIRLSEHTLAAYGTICINYGDSRRPTTYHSIAKAERKGLHRNSYTVWFVDRYQRLRHAFVEFFIVATCQDTMEHTVYAFARELSQQRRATKVLFEYQHGMTQQVLLQAVEIQGRCFGLEQGPFVYVVHEVNDLLEHNRVLM